MDTPFPYWCVHLILHIDKNKEFLLYILENQNLLGHEAFTDMLWTVFHVANELKARGDLKRLSDSEINYY